MKISDFLKRNFTLDDLKYGDIHRNILAVEQKQFEFGGRSVIRWVVHFQDDPRTLTLNNTNLEAVMKVLGDETNDWIGQSAILYETKFEYPRGCGRRELASASGRLTIRSRPVTRSRPVLPTMTKFHFEGTAMNKNKIAGGIREACEATGMGKTTMFEFIRDKKLQVRYLGRKAIIKWTTLRRWSTSLPTEAPK